MGRGQILVDFWEVGQGDCSVIHLPNGDIILIDVGPIGSPVVDWLSRQPRRKIHSIILTHNDSDHAGAITSLINCCRGRVGTVYIMVDRHIKNPQFRKLYREIERARKAKEIQNILRLEAPTTLWSDRRSGLRLDVKYPSISSNVLSSTPNETSAVLILTANGCEAILWAGDTSMANIASVASNVTPAYMLGPHHGAPTDRQERDFSDNLVAIAPRTIVASVGSRNRYKHPSVSYIKHARQGDARFLCTQLTKHCEKPSRLHHVCKGAALLGLPQATRGFSCRGTMRLTFDGKCFLPDLLAEKQHAENLKKLTRPKCLRYHSKLSGASSANL